MNSNLNDSEVSMQSRIKMIKGKSEKQRKKERERERESRAEGRKIIKSIDGSH